MHARKLTAVPSYLLTEIVSTGLKFMGKKDGYSSNVIEITEENISSSHLTVRSADLRSFY